MIEHRIWLSILPVNFMHYRSIIQDSLMICPLGMVESTSLGRWLDGFILDENYPGALARHPRHSTKVASLGSKPIMASLWPKTRRSEWGDRWIIGEVPRGWFGKVERWSPMIPEFFGKRLGWIIDIVKLMIFCLDFRWLKGIRFLLEPFFHEQAAC